MEPLSADLQERLEIIRKKNLYRRLRIRTEPGSEFIDLSHNDYLGLSRHSQVVEAAREALSLFGSGSTASRLVSGNMELHESFENRLAKFKGTESALLFPTGYQASLSLLAALPQKDDLIFLDRNVHACLAEGARLNPAKIKVFKHQNVDQLTQLLEKETESAPRKIWIVVDGVYSMDGDIAPLPDLLELAKKYNATLIVDDAHGTGVIGKTGRGITEHFGINAGDWPDHLILLATLSKALGSQGGVVLGSNVLRQYLINTGKTFIYSTGLNPGSVAAANCALELLEESHELVSRLHSRVTSVLLKAREYEFETMDSETAILPILTYSEETALQISAELKDEKIILPAIRPPTVPRGMSRLRFVVNLLESEDAMMHALGRTAHFLGKRKRSKE